MIRVFVMLVQRRGTTRWEDDPVVVLAEAGEIKRCERRYIGKQEYRVERVQ